MPTSGINKVKLDKVRGALQLAFSWDTSPQGFSYWREVQDNLLKIREEVLPSTPKVRPVMEDRLVKVEEAIKRLEERVSRLTDGTLIRREY